MTWLGTHPQDVDNGTIKGGITARLYFTHELGEVEAIAGARTMWRLETRRGPVGLDLSTEDHLDQWEFKATDSGERSYVDIKHTDTEGLDGTYWFDVILYTSDGRELSVKEGQVTVVLKITTTSDLDGAISRSYTTLKAQADATDETLATVQSDLCTVIPSIEQLAISLAPTLTSAVSSGAEVLELPDTSMFQVGDTVTVELDSGLHEATITVVEENEIEITPVTAGGASIGNYVRHGADFTSCLEGCE